MGEIFGDDVMAGALIDRLVHHSHFLNIWGNSYRLRQRTELARRRHTAPAPATERRLKRREATATAPG